MTSRPQRLQDGESQHPWVRSGSVSQTRFPYPLFSLPRDSLQQRLDVLHISRFRQMLIESGFQSPAHVLGAAETAHRDEHDLIAELLPRLARHLEAIDPRQTEVDQSDVRLRFRDPLQSCHTV